MMSPNVSSIDAREDMPAAGVQCLTDLQDDFCRKRLRQRYRVAIAAAASAIAAPLT